MTVCAVTAQTIAILALSKISRQFNYLLLKLDKYFLTIALQRPSEHMNCLTLEMAHVTHLFILIYKLSTGALLFYIKPLCLPLLYRNCASNMLRLWLTYFLQFSLFSFIYFFCRLNSSQFHRHCRENRTPSWLRLWPSSLWLHCCCIHSILMQSNKRWQSPVCLFALSMTKCMTNRVQNTFQALEQKERAKLISVAIFHVFPLMIDGHYIWPHLTTDMS